MYYKCNTGTSLLVVGLKTQPSVVKINSAKVAFNSSTCISTALTPISLVANNTNGYTYTWSTNNNTWTFGTGTGKATTTSVSNATVQLNANQSSGAVYLTTLGGCNSRVDTFYINRTLFLKSI